MTRLAFALWLLLAACGPETPRPDAGAPPAERAGIDPSPPGLTFDPGTIAPGDTLGELTVVAKTVERAAADSVWVGEVVFEGDLVVHGVYQSHPDWPSVQAPCFHVTDPASAARIPRFLPDAWTSDQAQTWFCFSNPDVALDVLGGPERPREMVIALSRYSVERHLGDGNDAAELSELIQLGPDTTRTLLDAG